MMNIKVFDAEMKILKILVCFGVFACMVACNGSSEADAVGKDSVVSVVNTNKYMGLKLGELNSKINSVYIETMKSVENAKSEEEVEEILNRLDEEKELIKECLEKKNLLEKHNKRVQSLEFRLLKTVHKKQKELGVK